MGFKKGFYIPKIEELIDNAFKKAGNEAKKYVEKDFNKRILGKEKTRIKIAAEELTSVLKNISNRFPNISELNPLYKALIANSINILKLKKALSHLNSSARTIEELKTKYLMQISKANQRQLSRYRTEAYGRIVSVAKRCKTSLETIRDALVIMADIPKIKNIPTILLIGTPNTGKSTFLQKVCSTKVDVQNYPFTTKRLQVGKITEKFIDFQILDSPGLLDRPEEKQNSIEKQTTIALKTIADSIIFIIDAKEEIKPQKNIIKRYKTVIKKTPYFIVLNKIDLVSKEELDEKEQEIKKDFPKTKLFQLSLSNANENETKELKQEIYNINKSWYTKKGKEKIKVNLNLN